MNENPSLRKLAFWSFPEKIAGNHDFAACAENGW